MRSSRAGAAALLANGAMGYLNTSPFFMFSTSSEIQASWASQIVDSSQINTALSGRLSSCPSEYYILVSQSGVSGADYSNSDNTPTLATNLQKSNPSIRSSSIVADVLGNVDTEDWEQTLSEKCKLTPMKLDARAGSLTSLPSNSKLLTISFPTPSKSSKLAALRENDAYLASLIDLLPSDSYTVLYTTTNIASQDANVAPERYSEGRQYEMDSPLFDIPHSELKRSLQLDKRQDDNDKPILVDGPLFDRYQYFTPGIWMGLFATFFLLSIMYVGISALTGLQVTYAAFDKENGPLASKKAQ